MQLFYFAILFLAAVQAENHGKRESKCQSLCFKIVANGNVTFPIFFHLYFFF